MPAGTAWRNRIFQELAPFIAGGDGEGFYCLVGILGVGIKQSGSFGTKTGRISGVFLVASGDDGPACQPCGGTYREVGVGGIAAIGCFAGGAQQFAVGLTQFFKVVYFDGNLYICLLYTSPSPRDRG